MSSSGELQPFILSMVGVGLFAGFVIGILRYEWHCPTRVAGLVGIPAAILGSLLALGTAAVTGLHAWTVFASLVLMILCGIAVLELGGTGNRTGY